MAREYNVQLNYNKLQYKKRRVDFFGETYTINGHKPAQTKVSSINTVPEPSSKKEVQSFIGMINFLSKFLPGYPNYLNPFRNYPQKEFHLTGDQNTEKPLMQ